VNRQSSGAGGVTQFRPTFSLRILACEKEGSLAALKKLQDLRTWVISITKCARQVVIARRRSRRSNPLQSVFCVLLDCFLLRPSQSQ
jgi:hypothetical protein